MFFFFPPLQGWAHRPRRATSQQGGELGHSERRSLFSRTLISLHLEESQHHLAIRITGRWIGGSVLGDLWHLFRTRRPVCLQTSTGRWKPFHDIIPSLCAGGDVYAAFRLRIYELRGCSSLTTSLEKTPLVSGFQYVCCQHWVKAVWFPFKKKKKNHVVLTTLRWTYLFTCCALAFNCHALIWQRLAMLAMLARSQNGHLAFTN